ncbi:MAG: S9 family peptidase [Muribaculaceae bacterium]|nr:S9 family peptidase [Muribaculaceae bacterium]MBQ2563556.1 S9 family peptidase [Muribaculaceae bacterium]
MASLAALMTLASCNTASNGGTNGGSDAAGGQAIEIKDGKFTPEVLLSLGRVGDPQVSPDGTRILYSVNYQDVKENKGNADLWLIDIEGKTPAVNITNTPSSESNAVWINDGSQIAFLYRDPAKEDSKTQVWVMDAKGGNRKPVSEMENGVDGFVISPDGTKIILVSQVKYGKTQPTDHYADLDKANARIIDDMMYKHWDQWVTEVPHPFVADFTGNVVKDPKDILEGTDYESPMLPWGGIESLAWTADSKQVIYTCRKKTGKEYAFSTNSDLYLFDVASGKTIKNLTEGMMGYDTNPRVFKDKVAFLSMEHDGYEADKNRIFVLDLKSGEKKDLTENWDYSADDLQWSPDGKFIYFLAPYQGTIPMFRVNVETQQVDTVTPGINDWHDYAAIVPLKDNKLLTLRHSYAEPNEIFSVEMGKEPVKLTTTNDALLAKVDSISMRKEIVKTTDGKDMTVWVVLPPNFDPNKKYPSIFFCEGGPQSPVSQFFSYRWNFRLMASQGYVVIAPNRRGLPGFGTEWNAQISGDYGGQNMKDYMSAATYMKQQPYIDGDRMGAVGASYGGYSVYWLAGNHNNMFACFLAHAGIFNLEAQYLETEEMWFTQWDLGGPVWEKDNAKAQKTYREANPINFVNNWNTPIMITAGELDYRIVFTQATQAFNAAKIRGIPARMVLFPEENHWILRPQNSLLWQREFFRWLDTWLKPGSEAAKAYKLEQDSIAKVKEIENKGQETPMPKTLEPEKLNIK